MNNIDKWCAEQCDVEIGFDGRGAIWTYKGVTYLFEWTIKDPRCREIVRERFHIETHKVWRVNDLWGCKVGEGRYDMKLTIAEAEIACITAIWEARDEIL